jgi:hypothetical protein
VAALAAQAFLVREIQADLVFQQFLLDLLRAAVAALVAVVPPEMGLLAVVAEQVYIVQLLGQTWAMLGAAQILLAPVLLHLVELIADQGDLVATGNLVQ